MLKPFALIFLSGLLSFSSALSQSIKLPQYSNIYPDTFAVYWQPGRLQKERSISIKVTLKSMFDDDLLSVESSDSLFGFVYDPEYNNERSLIISGTYLTNNAKQIYLRPADHILKIIPKNQKIEALRDLIITNASTSNLLLLADAYEAEKCFVNLFYIYGRIISKDGRAGELYLKRFLERHYDELNPSNVKR